MITVAINNRYIAIGIIISLKVNIETLDITSLGHDVIAKVEGQEVADWLADLAKRCTGKIKYNGFIISKESIRIYTGGVQ